MLWKIYCWLMVILIALALLVSGIDAHWGIHLVDWANLIFMVGGLTGAFGYAYKYKIATKNFWIYFTIISLAYQVAYSFILDQKYGALPASSYEEGLTTFLPLIPMFIALYLYIDRSKLFE